VSAPDAVGAAAVPAAHEAGLRGFAQRVRTAAWLGFQIEANWADKFTFVIYSVLRPLGLALILAGMYWAVTGGSVGREMFAAFYVANAFHEYVTRMVVAMGWVVVEEREEYETLRLVFTAPIGMFTYLWGRTAVKFAQATLSIVLLLAVGWLVLGVRWDWAQVDWLPLALSLVLGIVAVVHCGFLVAGAALLLPRAAVALNESLGVALYLLSGVIFPIDLLPRGVQEFTLALPFTYWYEALRRFLLGHGASQRLSDWPDLALVGALALSTLVFSVFARWGYRAMEHRARRLGRIDQATLF
jgi:ABC-2 type transport system permease protein